MNGRTTPRIPIGDKFLPELSIPDLKKLYGKEKNLKAGQRLQACIHRKQRESIEDIGKMIHKPYVTVQYWLVNIAKRGLEALYDKKAHGAPSRLSQEQLVELRADIVAGTNACGFESGVWTGKLVYEHIKNKFGVPYSLANIYRLLHKMNITNKVGRPVHPKVATESEKEEFKKKLNKR